VLYDQVVAHLLESIVVPPPAEVRVAERKWANGAGGAYMPYAAGEDGVPAMARPGDGHRVHTTGLTHSEDGFPTQKPEVVERVMARLLGKVDLHRHEIERYETVEIEDAEIVIVAYGIAARAARRAVFALRRDGVKVGLFRPITLWPFPEGALRYATSRARAVLAPEMNAGQLALEIERLVAGGRPVIGLNRLDGEPIAPDQIVAKARELAAHA
jgi:2-oxoglutarate ferredoxin oxidoreductase subunit alpha